MKLKLVSKGAQAQDIQVSDATFAREYNESLVHQVVVAYMAGGRAGTKAQKTQGRSARRRHQAVAPEGHRPGACGLDPQPDLGRRRRAFAAKPRDFSQKVNRKMYRGAMQAILSELARQDRLSVVNGIELEAPKTKLLVQTLTDLKLGSNVLIVIEAHDEKL